MEGRLWTDLGGAGGKMGKRKWNIYNIKKDNFARVAAVRGNKNVK